VRGGCHCLGSSKESGPGFTKPAPRKLACTSPIGASDRTWRLPVSSDARTGAKATVSVAVPPSGIDCGAGPARANADPETWTFVIGRTPMPTLAAATLRSAIAQ